MNEFTTTRSELEADIIGHVQEEIREALLEYAPKSWAKQRLEAIEQEVLDHTKMVLAALSTKELQSVGALRTHIAQAEADAKRLIRSGGVK